MESIFLSYRHDDAESNMVGRIRDNLKNRYGLAALFKDDYSIKIGSDWQHRIDTTLAAAKVVVVVIGPHWSGDGKGANGGRRIDESDDPVRRELGIALNRMKQDRCTIIPILIDGAQLPKQLPNDIQLLLKIQFQSLDKRDEIFDKQFDEIFKVIDPLLRSLADAPPVAAYQGGNQPYQGMSQSPETIIRNINMHMQQPVRRGNTVGIIAGVIALLVVLSCVGTGVELLSKALPGASIAGVTGGQAEPRNITDAQLKALVQADLKSCEENSTREPVNCPQSFEQSDSLFFPSDVTWKFHGDPFIGYTRKWTGHGWQIGSTLFITATFNSQACFCTIAEKQYYSATLAWDGKTPTFSSMSTIRASDPSVHVTIMKNAALTDDAIKRAVMQGFTYCTTLTSAAINPLCPEFVGVSGSNFVSSVTYQVKGDPTANINSTYSSITGTYHIEGTYEMSATFDDSKVFTSSPATQQGKYSADVGIDNNKVALFYIVFPA